MKAMILAAGYGTRLRPLTHALPKPMLPVCNRPLIGYAVESFCGIGINDIIVNLHHLADPIERFLTSHYGDQCTFHFSRELDILGTGGGVRKVRPLLESEEEFFLVNGDTVQFPPYDRLRQARQARDALAALVLRHPPQGERFTSVWFDKGVVTGFGRGTGEALMFSGAHLISSRIFRYLPEKEFSGIVDEVYQPVIAEGKEVVAGVIEDGPWFDIGTPRRYLSAAATILDMTLGRQIELVAGSRIVNDSVVDQTASLHTTVSRSSIGPRTYVKGQVRNSTIGADCRIASGAVLDSCLVGDGVEIFWPLQSRTAMICRDDPSLPRDPAHRYENGLVIAEF